jgi:hypothetical protein
VAKSSRLPLDDVASYERRTVRGSWLVSSDGEGKWTMDHGAWRRLDRTLDEIRTRFVGAKTEEQFQSVGHLCRDALISLAQAGYDKQRHSPLDGVTPSATDAKRMLDAYVACELSGGGRRQ